MIILVRLVLWNAPLLMDVILVGRVTDDSDIQSENVFRLIVAILLGIITDVSDRQPLKAYVPVVVRLLGRFTLVKAVLWNAP